MIRPLIAIAGIDLLITLRDRGSLIWMFLMPLIFVFIFGNAFQSRGPNDAARPLPVVLEDERFLGRVVIEGMRDETWDPYTISRNDSTFESLRTWIEIPRGFTDSVLSGKGAAIRLVERENGRAIIQRGFHINALKMTVETLTILFGIPDSILTTRSDAELETIYSSMAERPPPVFLSSRNAANIKKLPSGFLLAVPGNLVMFVLIVALTGGAAQVAIEAGRGHLRRLGMSPLTPMEIFFGKLLGRTVVAITQTAFLVVTSTLLFGMRWGSDPVALVLLLLIFSFVTSSIGVLLGLRIRKPETAASLGVLATLTMASLGGCWWPLEIVPDTMKAVGHIFPTAWAMDALLNLVAYEGNLVTIAPNLFILLGYGLLFGLLASRLLKFE